MARVVRSRSVRCEVGNEGDEAGEVAMPKKDAAPNPFTGRWRIVSMSAWDEEFINEEEEGYIEFDQYGHGDFHFGYVHGHMDSFVRLNSLSN
jgi:hypothetical protein